MERAFFLNDVYSFVGRPFPSSDFSDIEILQQPFTSKCSNLNRVILPFQIADDAKHGVLEFQLFQEGKPDHPVFKSLIDTSKFPAPSQIGSHNLKGVLHYLWIPPQSDSRDTSYYWELKRNVEKGPRGISIYLSRQVNPQLEFVRIDGVTQEGANAAFYTYCRYRFDWPEIFSTAWARLWREKLFLGFYLLLIGGLGICFRKLR